MLANQTVRLIDNTVILINHDKDYAVVGPYAWRYIEGHPMPDKPELKTTVVCQHSRPLTSYCPYCEADND